MFDKNIEGEAISIYNSSHMLWSGYVLFWIRLATCMRSIISLFLLSVYYLSLEGKVYSFTDTVIVLFINILNW